MVATLLMLDASGAFDNVHHDRLVECLARRGLPPPIVRWLREWLRVRRTRLKVPKGEPDWIELKYGIPQGSPLSPVLWLFYNAELLDEILQGARDLEGGPQPPLSQVQIPTVGGATQAMQALTTRGRRPRRPPSPLRRGWTTQAYWRFPLCAMIPGVGGACTLLRE